MWSKLIAYPTDTEFNLQGVIFNFTRFKQLSAAHLIKVSKEMSKSAEDYGRYDNLADHRASFFYSETKAFWCKVAGKENIKLICLGNDIKYRLNIQQ